MKIQSIKKALDSLLEKYQVRPSEREGVPGYFLLEENNNKQIPLQTWRLNRKFVELKRIIDTRTIEDPCMFRFCALGDRKQWNIRSLMYREFDLCEFLGNSEIISVQAVLNETAGNVIAKLANGIVCSVETGAQLEEGAVMIDRHEIIARRGVAGDLVVDTQLPQHSIYTFTPSGRQTYKDVDNELYGLEEMDVEWVRAVFELSKHSELQTSFIRQHKHLVALVEAAIQSNQQKQKIIL